jgi:SET domain-containing protein
MANHKPLSSGNARFFNTSTGVAEFSTRSQENAVCDLDCVFLRATTHIAPDEEIFVDYGRSYWSAKWLRQTKTTKH